MNLTCAPAVYLSIQVAGLWCWGIGVQGTEPLELIDNFFQLHYMPIHVLVAV